MSTSPTSSTKDERAPIDIDAAKAPPRRKEQRSNRRLMSFDEDFVVDFHSDTESSDREKDSKEDVSSPVRRRERDGARDGHRSLRQVASINTPVHVHDQDGASDHEHKEMMDKMKKEVMTVMKQKMKMKREKERGQADGNDERVKHATPPGKRRRYSPGTFEEHDISSSVPETEIITSDYDDIDEVGAETAYACGLNPIGLSEDEEACGLLPPGADVEAYAIVRNAILMQWRKDVSRELELGEVVDQFREPEKPYALAAWMFLDTMSYINFGVSKEQQDVVASSQGTNGTVIVIGAGCAGLAAARSLRKLGYKVVVVEGRNRPGGRVHTVRLSGPKKTDDSMNSSTDVAPPENSSPATAVADLGGSILTGIDGNPLAVIARQAGLPMMEIRDRTPLYMSDGTPADPELDRMVEEYYNHVLLKESDKLREKNPHAESISLESALETLWLKHQRRLGVPIMNKSGTIDQGVRCQKDYDKAKSARQLFEWHLANLEFANACYLSDLSLCHWDQDDPNELPGHHCFVPGCNGRWLKELCEGVPILYDSPVQEIRYSSSGVAIHTRDKVLEADGAVVTVPLGVLKREKIAFYPPLSRHKQDAISRLGFGTLNKVVLLFPSAFWGNVDMFGRVAHDSVLRGQSFLFYSYSHISGGAQLTALFAGKAGVDLERKEPAVAAARVMSVLRNIFEPRGVMVPAPLHVICTKWGEDPFCYGAYSSIPVDAKGGEDYDIVGESISDRIFFAGEATSRRHPATMHGAFYTGLWTAANVDSSLRKIRGMFGRVADKWKYLQGSIASRTHVAAQSARAPNRNNLSLHHGHGDIERLLHLSSRLAGIFEDNDYPPDLEFGSFAVCYGPKNSSVSNLGLVRFDISAYQKQLESMYGFTDSSNLPKFMPIYFAIEKEKMIALADHNADPMVQLGILACLPEARLFNRDEASISRMKPIIDAIWQWRSENTKQETQIYRRYG